MKNGDKRLGKGLDAILPSKEEKKKGEKKEEVEELEKKEVEKKEEERKEEVEEEVYTFRVKTLTKGVRVLAVTREHVMSINKKGETTTDLFTIKYMELLKDTIPRFNISEELGRIVREYVKKNNPELYEFIMSTIGEKGD